MIGQTETASSRGVSDYTNKQTQKKKKRGFFLFSFTTVSGLDINFPKYPACEAGGLIDYKTSLNFIVNVKILKCKYLSI